MKRILLAALGALALVSLNGCYGAVAPYSYGPTYGGGYYSQPVYGSGYVAPGYVAPAYRPARVYVAPPRPVYRAAVVRAPRYGRYW